jgi:hypothetical protein
MKKYLLLALLSVILIACGGIIPSLSDTHTISTCQNAIDAISSLPKREKPPEGFFKEGYIETGQEFDVNEYFSVLDHLSLEPGYTLDYAYFSDHLGGKPLVYARPVGQPPYTSYSEFMKAVGGNTSQDRSYVDLAYAYNYLEHVQTDGTTDGYIQFVILWMLGDQFYLYWHGGYNDTAIICSADGLKKLEAELKNWDLTLPTDVAQKARKIDFRPTVELKEDKAVVKIVLFSKWSGFSEVLFTLSQDFPHELIDSEIRTHIEYDCGIRF